CLPAVKPSHPGPHFPPLCRYRTAGSRMVRGTKGTAQPTSLLARPGTTTRLPRLNPAYPSSATRRADIIDASRTRRDPVIPAVAWNPVRVGPGHTAVTVTPEPESSPASPSLSDST